MQTILKKGTKPRKIPATYIKKCFNCGCKFTYSYEDIHHSYALEEYYVECPQCTAYCYIIFKRKYRPKNKSVKN